MVSIRMRAKRAIIASQMRDAFARLAQILRSANGALLRMTIPFRLRAATRAITLEP